MANQRTLKKLEDIASKIDAQKEALLAIIAENSAKNNTDFVEESRKILVNFDIISSKLRKVGKFLEFEGYRFCIIDPSSGNIREATHDESVRMIMGYKRGNVLEIMRDWTVVNGEWVRRENENPPA